MLNQYTATSDLIQRARSLSYATPYFYTSRDVLKQNYELFTTLFTNAEVYYAVKANADARILLYLDSLGCGFEAASAYEIKQLTDLGVDPAHIIYGTSIKPSQHIAHAFHAGIRRFAADSKEEIEKIALHAPRSKVYIRAIVDDTGSVFMMSERFGAPVEAVKNLLLHARHLDLKTYGISFYVGSQAAHANMWAKGIRSVKSVIEELLAENIRLEVLNIGGGFPVHYDNAQDAPELVHIVEEVNQALAELPYAVKVILEPGRGIVATSTLLVSSIVARSDRFNVPWLCMDAGIYNALYEAMIHQGATRYPVHLLNPPFGDVQAKEFTLAGPTGDSLDVIARNVKLPDYIGVGDKLIFEHAGAYTVTMANGFNGFPQPNLYIG